MAKDKKAKDTVVRPAKGRTATEALLTGAALVAGLILLNVIVSWAGNAQVDLTENQIYSLSSPSKAMVKSLDEKINVKAYFGNVPVYIEDKQRYIEALLAEYADASGGKVTFEKIDPTGDTALMDELKKEGVDKITLRSFENDKREQIRIYFHVVFQYLDKKEIWTPQGGFSLEGLEYEFSSRIKRLGKGKRKVGITTGFGEPAATQVLKLDGRELVPGQKFGLADLYEVVDVDWAKDPRAIEGVDVLIVNGPSRKVSDAAKLALDQFVMSGKPALIFARGIKWERGGNEQMPPQMAVDQPYVGMPSEHGLGELLEHWGFKVEANTILDGRASAMGIIPPGTPNGLLARAFFPYAQVGQNGPREMMQGIDVVVAPWSSVMKLVGPLENAGEEFKVLPLMRTAPSSFAREGVMAITREMKLNVAANDARGPFLVAAAASGKWKSFYAGKALPEGVPPGTELLPEAPANTRLIVSSAPAMVEDASLADIRFHGDRTYTNGFLAAHNMVDWLAEDTDLVAARTKVVERPLEAISDGKKTALKVANVAGPPLFVVLFGLLYWQLRERSRRNIRL